MTRVFLYVMEASYMAVVYVSGGSLAAAALRKVVSARKGT